MRSNYLSFSLYQIQIFLEACAQKSFTATAQRMQTSQSAISKTIASMEQVLGFPLFFREKNRLELSPAGALLYEEWEGIVSGVELSIDRAYALATETKQSLVIGEPDSIRHYEDYMPAVRRFEAAHPEVKFFYRQEPVGYLIPLLLSGELDLLFTIAYDTPMLDTLHLCYEKISSRPLTLSVHKSHPLAQRDKIDFSDLREEEFYVLSPAKHPNYMAQLRGLCAEHGYSPKIGYCAANPRSAMISLLRNGRGVLFTDSLMFDDASPEVKHFPLDHPDSGLVMAWRENTKKETVSALVEEIRRGSVENK